jgi:hypothetical protein
MDVAGVIALEDPDRDTLVRIETRHLLCRNRSREEKNDADDGRQRSTGVRTPHR